ncbi:hypothetical protein F5883DRAFT_48583 [Diaporthe sp. PMI_573]|nr:hypothetical protein F5883DRAFT_48583 [Diaporthaceae sp. PMI_573]
MRLQDEQPKKQELLQNHYGFAYMNFFLIALARHSSSANSTIRVLTSLLSSRILSLIQSFYWIPAELPWLYNFVSQMAVIMAFLGTLVPNHQAYFTHCIDELHKTLPAFRQSPDSLIHFIQSQGMQHTVTNVVTGLQNVMRTMKRKLDLSESDFQVAFVESFEKCRALVNPDDKQRSTAADQLPNWNNQDNRATEGSQMDSAAPDLQFHHIGTIKSTG